MSKPLKAINVELSATSSKWTLPREFWEIFVQVVVLVTIVTNQAIFWYMCSYDHRVTEETLGLLIVFYACDLVYLVDTIFRWRRIRVKTKKPNFTFCEKTVKFLPTIADGISLFPLEIFALFFGTARPSIMKSESMFEKQFEDGSIGRALVLVTFGRLESFHKTFAILKINRLIRLYRFPAFYETDEKNKLRLNPFAVETLKLAICFACFLVLLCHSIACIWFSMNCSGVVYRDHAPVCQELGKGFHSIYKYSTLNQTDPFIWYLGGLHWSVMSLRNSGDRVMVPTSSLQMVYSVLTQFIGFYMTIFIFLLTIHIATILDLKRSKFFHEALGARSFAKQMEMDKGSKLIKFMDKSFNFMWKKSRGFSDAKIITILPKRLCVDIAMSIFTPMIQKSEILRTCFKQKDLEFMASDVQFKHYFGNSFLLRPSGIGASMFYVVRGSVDIMDTNEKDPTILFTLGPGSLIGEEDAFFPRMRTYGVKTRLECDVVTLNNASVNKILTNENETAEKVIKIIKKRTEFGRKFYPEAAEFLPTELEDTPDLSQEESIASSTAFSSALIDGYEFERKKHKRNRYSNMVHMTPLSWIIFSKKNFKSITTISDKSKAAEENLKKYPHLPEGIAKYNFIPIPPAPEHRWKYCVVSKKSFVASIWYFLVFATALIYSYGLPVCVMLNDERRTRWIDDSVDAVYILDLAFRLLVFYDSNEMHHTIPLRLAHIQREFKNPAILLSIIPIIPIHHFLRVIGAAYRNFLYVRLHLYFVRFITVHLYFGKWEQDVRVNVVAMRMLKNTIYMSIYIVFFSCLFCSFGCLKYPNCEQSEGETWVGQYLKSAGNSTYQIKEFYYAFYLSLHWTLSSMIGIGYANDYLALVQKKETTLFTVHLVLSFFLLAYFFANVGAAISGHNKNK